ncbi:hypothetical protein [Geodermatophilus sabuli]|uniref:Uncharacterized protein n=1 Tax=Geodermatophilus sabuli TaxID=1564158 RepID=A0A285E6V5_9ACTN|nr:hypothetical protein [Geodermatophilus sabuli]MBB3082317.1 hypothetical protein [Geodermatophilus sabuli]SNX94812.1 hypothetical protein SAMN06893097_101609 [Geodermatophilus sabuli]
MDLLLYAVLTFAPAGSFIAFAKALEWWTREHGATRSGAGSRGSEIKRLAGDLRRLECDYCRIERSDLPRRSARLQSVSLAYDDTLWACCEALDIPWPGRPPFDGVHRLEMEASLAQRGVIW